MDIVIAKWQMSSDMNIMNECRGCLFYCCCRLDKAGRKAEVTAGGGGGMISGGLTGSLNPPLPTTSTTQRKCHKYRDVAV
jgi:hypothetical protein